MAHVSEIAKELNIPIHWSLPLVSPLPFHSMSLLYLELHPQTYLVVSVKEGLLDQYHLLNVSPSSLDPAPTTIQASGLPAPPKIFFAISSLTELELEGITMQHLRLIQGAWVGRGEGR